MRQDFRVKLPVRWRRTGCNEVVPPEVGVKRDQGFSRLATVGTPRFAVMPAVTRVLGAERSQALEALLKAKEEAFFVHASRVARLRGSVQTLCLESRQYAPHIFSGPGEDTSKEEIDDSLECDYAT